MNATTAPAKFTKPLTRTAKECAEAAVCQAHVDPATLPEDRETLEGIYRKVRSDAPLSKAAFDAAVRAILDHKVKGGAEAATPRQWVKAALRVETKCDKCQGSGMYGWGAFVNGKPTHCGECYACNAKGVQRHDDWVRNANYWRFFVRLY